ncbi:sulfurtransferase [Halpernia sp.]|uniref:sulfurtransferase n=1 Tax=Halpernia sp. TaxID=2782209 RepID=UPI003A92B14C
MKLSPIISAKELQKILSKENLIIVDAGSGGNSYDNFLKKHLQNALYVDLNKDLAAVPENPKFGGRHPLPKLDDFFKVLQRLGISKNSHIIIYDNKFGANAASRFWWMLKSVGIENVQVLDGGLQMAEKLGFPMDFVENKVQENSDFKLLNENQDWTFPQINLDFVKNLSQNPEFTLIDVRDKARYDGETEPIDKIAGHIPYAKNLPFNENLNEDGTFKKPEVLKEQFNQFFKNYFAEKTAISCGSGVTACHTILAMAYAGFEIPKLYVGSYSEWINQN